MCEIRSVVSFYRVDASQKGFSIIQPLRELKGVRGVKNEKHYEAEIT